MSQNNYISPEKINQIRLAADILEVIGSRIRLENHGRDLWGLCPFHGDTHPSLKVDRQRGIWYCFGCGEGGSVFNFVMRDLNLSFPEAVRELAQRFDITLPSQKTNFVASKHQKNISDIMQSLQLANSFFIRQLESPPGLFAQKYLIDQRKLSHETIAAFGLGWAPNNRKALGRFLAEQKISEELAIQSGLLIPRGKYSSANLEEYYDRFYNRIMIPIHDASNQVISFGARALNNNQPKYLNGPETLVFYKSCMLYNFNSSKNYIRSKNRVLIVEGYFDVITLVTYGFKETVSPLGTALTSQQLRILKGQTSKLILIFDNDQAGNKAIARALPIFLREGLSAHALILPPDYDPDSFLRTFGAKAFELALTKVKPLTEIVLHQIIKQGDSSSPEGRSKIITTCGNIIKGIKDPIIQTGYLEQIANYLKLSIKLVATKIGLSRMNHYSSKSIISESQKCHRIQNNLRSILELALASPKIARILLENGKSKTLLEINKGEDPNFAELIEIVYAMTRLTSRDIEITADTLILELPDQTLAPLVASLAQRSPQIEPSQARTIALDLLKQIRINQILQEQETIKKKLSIAEAQDDLQYLTKLQIRHKELIQRLYYLRHAKD